MSQPLPTLPDLPDLGDIMEVDNSVLSARRRERFVLPLDKAQSLREATTLFPAVSLAAWAHHAQAAGIPTVPAEVVCRIPVDAVLCFGEQRAEDMVHWQALHAACGALKPDEMLRMDCCASADLKFVMSEGGEQSQLAAQDQAAGAVPAWRSLPHLACPRIFDLAYEYPGDEIAVLKRPWVQARREGSHPVEYRVFVRNGEVLGVANYYIQRGLPASVQVMLEVEQALAHTRRLVGHLGSNAALPFNVGAGLEVNGFDPDRISCTMDFLVDEQGSVRFLEAGPPFGLGAHPCAFMHNTSTVDGRERISVEGLCLSVGGQVLSLADVEARAANALRHPRGRTRADPPPAATVAPTAAHRAATRATTESDPAIATTSSNGTRMPTKPSPADKAYDAAAPHNSAFFGVFLFKERRLEEEEGPFTPLRFCTGDGEWVPCPGGMPEVRRLARRSAGDFVSSRDMADDWGMVCDEAGVITHRADWPDAQIRELTYLGRYQGPLATASLTREEAYAAMGMRFRDVTPAPRTADRQRG